MATDKDFPQIESQSLAADRDELEKEEVSHLSINYVSYNRDELHNRCTPLRAKLGKIIGRVYSKVRFKFKSHRCCVWSSKAVVLILSWNLIISIGFTESFFDPSLYTVLFNDIDYDDDDDDYFSVMLINGLPYGLNALLFLFYPLAGFMADVCWGRYTTVKK